MEKRSNFIPNDGYTEKGYVQAEPHLHDECRFTFRPMLSVELGELLGAVDTMGAAAYERKVAGAVADKIIAWNLEDESGKMVPILLENILRIKPRLLRRICNIVQGTQVTDVDPLWSDDLKCDAAIMEHQAAVSGTTPGVAREAADAGN